MIKSIRISRDQFAAEYHSAGGVAIDIVTQPGLGRMQYFSSFRARGSGLDGRSPFTPTRGAEQNLNYGFGMFGALIKNKASMNMNIFGIDSYDTPNLNAAFVGGTRSEALRLRAPRDLLNVNAQMDYAMTLDQLVRFGYSTNRVHNENMGVGGYDEEERAFTIDNRVHNLQVQQIQAAGSARVPEITAAVFVDRRGEAVGQRSDHDPGARCVHERRCPGRRRSALEDLQRPGGSGLRARSALLAHRHLARQRLAQFG
jgi:hypothetical protein